MLYIGLQDNAKACHKEEVASYCFHVPDSSIATVTQHRNSSRSSEIVTRVNASVVPVWTIFSEIDYVSALTLK